MKLIEDYESRMAGCKKKKITNERVANSLYIVSFIASAVATVFVAAGAGPKELVAVLAAIPAIVTLALSIFKPDGRSQWWAAKYGKLDDLVRAIKYEKMSVSKHICCQRNVHALRSPITRSMKHPWSLYPQLSQLFCNRVATGLIAWCRCVVIATDKVLWAIDSGGIT